MIEWLSRVDPSHPFLMSEGRSWTYGDALAQVERRVGGVPRLCFPSLQLPTSLFDVIAGVVGGGATVVGKDPETTSAVDADLVVYTSGSSGTPKGVRLTRGNLTAAAAASAEHLGHGPDDNWLLAMPLNHVGGLAIVFRQMFSGGSVTLLPTFEPGSVAAAIHGGVTMASVVPTMLQRILGHGPFSGPRAVLVGGGPIPDGLLETAASAGLPVLPTYGMTETFGQVATLRPGAPLQRKMHPLPGIDLRIEEDGRIAVRGEQVSPGYVGEPDRAEEWFVTNDLGELDDEGALMVLGRVDTVIVTGGENVDPARVETILEAHPDVDGSVVAGTPDDEWGSIVVCAYAGAIDVGELTEWARGRMPPFMVPKKWEKVASVPRTPLGKPDRAAVAALF